MNAIVLPQPVRHLSTYLQTAEELKKIQPAASFHFRMFALAGLINHYTRSKNKDCFAVIKNQMALAENFKRCHESEISAEAFVKFALVLYHAAKKEDERKEGDVAKSMYLYIICGQCFDVILNSNDLRGQTVDMKESYAAMRRNAMVKAIQLRKLEMSVGGSQLRRTISDEVSTTSSNVTLTESGGPIRTLKSLGVAQDDAVEMGDDEDIHAALLSAIDDTNGAINALLESKISVGAYYLKKALKTLRPYE